MWLSERLYEYAQGMEMQNSISLGIKIRQLRQQQGYSQESFANYIEMNRAYYGTIERGKANLTISNLLKIAKGLGVSMSDLFLP